LDLLVAVASGADRLGTIDLPFPLKRRGLLVFWLLDLLVAVASGADRLGTIDLPFPLKRRGLLVLAVGLAGGGGFRR
jgi:hypothetical protein